MLHDNQDSHKLNFVKDALIEEDYTRDMVSMVMDMTDDVTIGIFDELKISSVKRPKFRNAVKPLKQRKDQINRVFNISPPQQHKDNQTEKQTMHFPKQKEKKKMKYPPKHPKLDQEFE